MFAFLNIQYQLGVVSKDQLAGWVTKWITAEQYKKITGEDYNA